mgnify:CR=1 FL=1
MFYTFGSYIEREKFLEFLKKLADFKKQDQKWSEELILNFLLVLSEADLLLKQHYSEEQIKETQYYSELSNLYNKALSG